MQMYLQVSQQPIVPKDLGYRVRRIGYKGGTKVMYKQRIIQETINSSDISQEDKNNLVSQLDDLYSMRYWRISTFNSFLVCSSVLQEVEEKHKQNIELIKLYNAKNKQFKDTIKKLKIRPLYESLINSGKANVLTMSALLLGEKKLSTRELLAVSFIKDE